MKTCRQNNAETTAKTEQVKKKKKVKLFINISIP